MMHRSLAQAQTPGKNCSLSVVDLGNKRLYCVKHPLPDRRRFE
ncbi:hypothetical protein Y025_5585 [Burkholderia pseudomallei TSV32]|nr:hypothetical protein Y025_5585 [Burkholderia pseudomallei TSV32]